MAKFIKFDVKNTLNAANLLLQGTRLLNVDHIGDIAYNAATGAVTIVLTTPAGAFGEDTATAGISGRVVTAVVTTNTTGAAGIPTITAGSYDPARAIYKAMTANPGGVVSTAQLGKDQAATPVQMYWSTYVVATNDQV
tara:strand:+ start:58 stop:471 length:414 start_codon:yes stop_codon:yes gene_type:complete